MLQQFDLINTKVIRRYLLNSLQGAITGWVSLTLEFDPRWIGLGTTVSFDGYGLSDPQINARYDKTTLHLALLLLAYIIRR